MTPTEFDPVGGGRVLCHHDHLIAVLVYRWPSDLPEVVEADPWPCPEESCTRQKLYDFLAPALPMPPEDTS
jgi:hypothetical protein